ncbi:MULTISPECIES: hypothetical protein [unclassified Myroides]|uniref:hypothetical protein n=1 Tax=unclassified Myroides TaxID=2642485 RepID=UPI003D2F6648
MKAYFASVFIFCCCLHSMAQENPMALQVVEHKGQLLIQSTPKDILNKTTIQQDNLVAVLQIGQHNTVHTAVQSSTSDLSYTQQGNNNLIDIVAKGEDIKHNIAQYGDQNSFENYSFSSSGQQALELIQQGNKQEVSIFGENSMSKDMKITIEGNEKTLMIRNFN